MYATFSFKQIALGGLFNFMESAFLTTCYSKVTKPLTYQNPYYLSVLIDLTDYSLFTQWPRFRVKHLLEFVGSGAKLQLCY